MAQPFTPEQREAIRARLVASARRHALDTGFKKTSLDMLTAEAGISKSSFYKFFDSKEMLFLEIAGQWESQVISAAMASLAAAQGRSDKERAAAMVLTAFETIHKLASSAFCARICPRWFQPCLKTLRGNITSPLRSGFSPRFIRRRSTSPCPRTSRAP